LIILLRRLISPDPNTFGFAFSVWAAIVGISLLTPGNAFDFSPAWASLQQIHATDQEWGVAMMVDSILLFCTIRMQKFPFRAAIAISSSVMWTLLGVSMIFNGWKAGFVSVVGAYSVWCSILTLLAVGQWIIREGVDGAR
jgi:hypothetical protein